MTRFQRFRKSIAFGYLLVILGTFSVAALILGASFLATSYANRIAAADGQAKDRAAFISAVIPEAVFTEDFLTLETLMRQTAQDPLIVYSLILDKSGRAMTRSVDRDDPVVSDVLAQLETGATGGILGVADLIDSRQGMRSIVVPVQAEGVLLGEVRLGYTVASIWTDMVRDTWQVLGVLILSSMVLTVATVLVFNLRVGRPLLTVRDLAQALTDGDLSQRATVQPGAEDEIAQLKRSFNAMADQLQETLNGLRLSQEQTEKLSMVAARTDNMVIISDARGRIEWVNQAFTRVTGYELEEVVGHTPGSILQGPNTDPDVVAFMRSQLTAQEGFTCEILNYDKFGKEYWTAVEIQPVLDEQGNLTNYIALESDITQRRAADVALRQAKEEAEAANRAKSIFLANMSHELRTPLNAIIGYSEMLLEDYGLEDDPGVADDLGRIQSAGRHLLALISDILDLSKIEAGRMEIYLENFDAGKLMGDVASTVTSLIQKNDNQLFLNLPQEEMVMETDMTKVRQILFNLLSNAAKFTEGGTITATVRRITQTELAKEMRSLQNGQPVMLEPGTPEFTFLLARPDGPSTTNVEALQPMPGVDWVRFSVTDTGIGMDAAQIEAVFQAFKQGDPSTTRKYGGTGLGLAISHRFSLMLGGTIQVRSTVGEGTTFCVCLPQIADYAIDAIDRT